MGVLVDEIIKKTSKDWGVTSEELLGSWKAKRIQRIPLSSPLSNWCLFGGIPRNKISEFYGEPGGGKSTTAVDVCKNAITVFTQDYEDEMAKLRDDLAKGNKSANGKIADLEERGPLKVIYLDIEHGFDVDWIKTLGVDESTIVVLQPPNVEAECVLDMMIELVKSGEVGLIVMDSIPALVPKAELDKKLGEKTVAPLANLLTRFCRKINQLLARHGCTLIMINQIRDNQQNPYYVKTPGGQAAKFFSTLRLEFRRGDPVDAFGAELPKSAETPAGYIINLKVTKQKSAAPSRKLGSYYLMASTGIQPMFDYVQLAIKRYGLIKKAGGWYTLIDPYTGEVMVKPDTVNTDKPLPLKLNGLGKVYEYLSANPEYYDLLKQYITDDINDNGIKTGEDEDEG